MSGQILYKAKVACRVGGAYRKAGEVFPMPEFEVTPSFLARVEAPEPAPEPPGPAPAPTKAPAKAKKGAEPPGPVPEDLPGVVRD